MSQNQTRCDELRYVRLGQRRKYLFSPGCLPLPATLYWFLQKCARPPYLRICIPVHPDRPAAEKRFAERVCEENIPVIQKPCHAHSAPWYRLLPASGPLPSPFPGSQAEGTSSATVDGCIRA